MQDSSQVDETFRYSSSCEVMLCAKMVTAPDNTSEQGVPRPLSNLDVYVTGVTSERRSSTSTERIWIRFEALGSGVRDLYFGPLSCSLAYFPKVHQTAWEDASVRFRHSNVNATPILSVFKLFCRY
jgi:hypothetical protein